MFIVLHNGNKSLRLSGFRKYGWFHIVWVVKSEVKINVGHHLEDRLAVLATVKWFRLVSDPTIQYCRPLQLMIAELLAGSGRLQLFILRYPRGNNETMIVVMRFREAEGDVPVGWCDWECWAEVESDLMVGWPWKIVGDDSEAVEGDVTVDRCGLWHGSVAEGGGISGLVRVRVSARGRRGMRTALEGVGVSNEKNIISKRWWAFTVTVPM